MSLPETANHQEFLLTLSTLKTGLIQNVLPGVHVAPLFIDTDNGVWVLRVQFEPGVSLPKHYHTGSVHVYTLSGCWYYLEYPEEKQTEGCYIYEPGGSIHQFMAPHDNDALTDTIMMVNGANVNFDEDGNFLNIMDASWIEAMIQHVAKQQGITPHYIKPGAEAGFSSQVHS